MRTLNDGATPVYLAAEFGHEPVARALAALGANLATPTILGQAPVYVAASNGHEDVLRALVSLDVLTQDGACCGGERRRFDDSCSGVAGSEREGGEEIWNDTALHRGAERARSCDPRVALTRR